MKPFHFRRRSTISKPFPFAPHASSRLPAWLFGVVLLGIPGTLPIPACAEFATTLAAGDFNTCALTSSGGVKCWGGNSNGELGDGSTMDRLVPVDVVGLTAGVKMITAGAEHTCALTDGGGVKCWGLNNQGQLGDGTSGNSRLTPVDVVGLTSGVVGISAGQYHTCAVTASGGAKCWGYNVDGQLGDGTLVDEPTPVDVAGLTSGVATIHAGARHTCALTGTGNARCWGQNSSGQLGDGTTTTRLTPVDVSGLTSNVSTLAAGGSHSCAVTSFDGVKCWGGNAFGQIGDGSTTVRLTPVNVATLASGVTAIAAGGGHTCALTSEGVVECWGLMGSDEGAPTLASFTPLHAIDGVVTVSSGGAHNCALTLGGAVKCWGQSLFGELGDGTTHDSAVPVQVKGFQGGAGSVVAGELHSCALLASGVRCWGYNSNGQLGDGTLLNHGAPVNVIGLPSNTRSITAGGRHTCALAEDGVVRCWGANWAGQLGDGTTADHAAPVTVVGLSARAVLVRGGDAHTCALLTTGGVECWGYNVFGQLGDGTTTDHLTPTLVAGLSSGVLDISLGDSHTCALLATRDVRCWGQNGNRQLGDGTTIDRVTPVNVSGLNTSVISIATGSSHTCAVTSSGGIRCWGYNGNGQLGSGSTGNPVGIVDVLGLGSAAAKVTAGGAHTCALDNDGQAACWGENSDGELGDGTTSDRTSAQSVPGLGSSVAAIAAGHYHSCALIRDGTLRCFGDNLAGQIGDNATIDRLTPVTVTALVDGPAAMSGIAVGGSHTCTITSLGGVKCSGSNANGQLGDGTSINRLTAVNVRGLESGVIAVAAGDRHTCALTSGGGVKCWGDNSFGALGDGTTTQRLTPVDVSGLGSGIVGISTGQGHTCALTSGGGVKCWGANSVGALGDGTFTSRPTPTDVSGLNSGVVAIAAGGHKTCALVAGGGVRCWGWNPYGGLGDGTTTPHPMPVDVSGLGSGVIAIAAGYLHVCALTSGGGVKCWGDNFSGDLGDGTTTQRLTPVDVSGLGSGIVGISTGQGHTCALTSGGGVKCWGYNVPGLIGDGTTTGRLTAVGVSGLGSGIVSVAVGANHTCALAGGGGVKCWGGNFDGQLGDGTATNRLTPVTLHQCGDFTREPGEVCDDGNLVDGDCCSALCDLEQTPGGSCQTVSQVISSSGGTIASPDATVWISIPSAALGSSTLISIEGRSGSTFNLGAGAQTAVAVDFGPSGQTFSSPATITLSWPDKDDNGVVQETSPPLYESHLIVYHNGVAITGECGDPSYRPGTCTTVCCDQVHNTWTFQTSSFSEFAAAAPACDPIAGAKLKLTKLNKPGANGLSLKGDVSLSPGDLSALNPVTDGVRLLLSDASNGLLDMAVPGGAYDRVAKKGWKVNASGTTWTFIDMTKPSLIDPTPRTGISKVVVKRSTSTPGSVSIQVTGKNASYSIMAPPVVDVILNQNVCFRASFPGPGLPLCYYNGTQTTLVCR